MAVNFGGGLDFDPFADEAEVDKKAPETAPAGDAGAQQVSDAPDDVSEDEDDGLDDVDPMAALGGFGSIVTSDVDDDDDNLSWAGGVEAGADTDATQAPYEPYVPSGNHYIDADATGDLSRARDASRKGGIGRSLLMAICGLAGVAVALTVSMLVLQSGVFGGGGEPEPTSATQSGDSGVSVTTGELPPEEDSGVEDATGEEEAPHDSALDEIVDTGNGYGVSKLVADGESKTISLHGRIKNLTEDVHEAVALAVMLYDGEGTVIGVANAYVDRVEAGEVVDFVATNENVKTSAVSSVALVEVRW